MKLTIVDHPKTNRVELLQFVAENAVDVELLSRLAALVDKRQPLESVVKLLALVGDHRPMS